MIHDIEKIRQDSTLCYYPNCYNKYIITYLLYNLCDEHYKSMKEENLKWIKAVIQDSKKRLAEPEKV